MTATPARQQTLPLPRLALLAACTSLGPLALNVYLPSLPVVRAEFDVPIAALQSTVSLALLSFGLGLLLLGPLADRYGRRPALLCGLALFIAGTALAAFAGTLSQLLVGRMVASCGAAMTFLSSRAVVADLTPRDRSQRSIAQMTMIMLMVQMIAPLLGNIAVAAGSWRAIQYALLLLGVVLFGLVWSDLAESLPAPAAGEPRRSLLAPTLSLLRRQRFVLLLTQNGLLYSAYPAFVAMAPYLMVNAFHRPTTEYGYYFVALPLGYFLGNGFVLRFGQRQGHHRLVMTGASIGALACVLCAVLLAAGLWQPWVMFATLGVLLNFGMGLALPSASARAVDESWPNAASGWGLVGFAQQSIAAIAVQSLALFKVISPYPVVGLCLALTGITLVLEQRAQRATRELA